MANGTLNSGGETARSYLEKALKLAEASTVPKETALLPQIKAALTMLNEMSAAPLRAPRIRRRSLPVPGSGRGRRVRRVFFDDDFDEDDDE